MGRHWVNVARRHFSKKFMKTCITGVSNHSDNRK